MRKWEERMRCKDDGETSPALAAVEAENLKGGKRASLPGHVSGHLLITTWLARVRPG